MYAKLLKRLREAAGMRRAPNSPPPPQADFPPDDQEGECARCKLDLSEPDDQCWVSEPYTATIDHVRMVCANCVQAGDKLLLDGDDVC